VHPVSGNFGRHGRGPIYWTAFHSNLAMTPDALESVPDYMVLRVSVLSYLSIVPSGAAGSASDLAAKPIA